VHRKKTNISTVLAGQRLGIKEVDERIWLVTFIDYDLGYIDLEQKTLQPLDNPLGQGCHPFHRYVLSPMSPGRTESCRYAFAELPTHTPAPTGSRTTTTLSSRAARQ